uniref:Ig-like domain-containing protein n=1 Tax=Hucho hucho TaxID=62062 RepID=A0A4W5PPG3_9TELE
LIMVLGSIAQVYSGLVHSRLLWSVAFLILFCNYTTSRPSSDLFWYIQLSRDSPQYVLRRDRYSEGSNSDEFKKRFDSRLNFTSSSVPLTIQRLQLSDSAVYYCALRPTVTTGYSVTVQ